MLRTVATLNSGGNLFLSVLPTLEEAVSCTDILTL